MASSKYVSFAFQIDNRPNRFGRFVVYIRITQDRKKKYVKTSVAVSNKNWFNKNAKNENWIRQSDPEFAKKNETLAKELAEAKAAYSDLIDDQGVVTPYSVKAKVEEAPVALSFLEFVKEHNENLHANGQIRYWKQFRDLANKLELFRKKRHHFLAKAANAGNVDASHLLYSYFGETVLSNDKYNYAIHQSIIESKLHGLENRAQKGEIRYEVVADAYLDAFKEGILFTPEYQYNDTLYIEYDSGIGSRWSVSYRPRKYNYTLDQAIRYYYEAENYERVFDLYQDFIGHTEIGKLYMGLCFYHRRGAQESSFEDDDSEQGLKMIEDAAKRNNPTAMLILGNILRKKGQYEEAVHWYRIASHFGHREAMRNLALCYDKGLGTDVNKTLAKGWLKKAKELGDLKQ